MFKTLLKKQFLELKNVFLPVKNGKKNKKRIVVGTTGAIVLLAVVSAASVCFNLLIADVLCAPLAASGFSWLYFCLTGLFTVGVGSIFGIISVYTGLYRATDNDLLLSLPVKPALIVFTRISSNYLVDLFLTVITWIPFSVRYFTVVTPSALSVLFCFLALLFIPLLCSAIALALGFIISLITMKLKNKGIFVVIISVALIALYYVLYFRIGSLIKGIIANPESTGAGFKTYGFLFYRLGLAATGDALSALIVFGVSSAVFIICYVIISVNFIKMSTISAKNGKVKAAKNPYKMRSVKSALLKRESQKFFSDANYMLNCGMSSLLILAFGVCSIIFREDLNAVIANIAVSLPIAKEFSLIIIPVLLFTVLFMGTPAAPSVSLEGSALWVVRSSPVKSKDVLMAKEYFQIVLTAFPTVFFALSASIILSGDVFAVISITAFAVSSVLFTAAFSLYVGTLKADVKWLNETTAIKSNIGVLILLLTGFAAMIVICGLYYLLVSVCGFYIPAKIYIAVYAVILFALFFIVNKAITVKGVEKFENL